ncbi:RNA polymerase sigma factor [Caulobacter sp. UNC279MFTsu5.1]|uniref:RNA polymerase sigma factor n=1 Tax=Caulobacter sp. UNC279MFTsu5.1 TaxID=1502775 RepID=UPI0008EB5DEB|nr:RNA polymerase sigma factor [Caulobacter sp. UNC279MFTsu5.1]SFI59992.1 RNA polymerase sigma-70 factor, ECF subfamily [Caulobacter sp. UNC279MFTsu5.1]
MTRQSSDPTKAKRRLLDGYLVVAAQAGDRQAADLLARRYHRRLIAHAWRLTGDMELARDVVQSSWMDIARGLPGLKDEAAFPAWAYQIVSRRCARNIRGLQGDRALAGALREVAQEGPTEPPEIATPRLQAAVRALPGPLRAALALFYFDDLSVAEIAVALEIPAGTVKTRLMHARRALRAVLEGDHHV